jgi:hypothetical protein
MSTIEPWAAARKRRHRDRILPSDRVALERAGWRTMLEYRENHVRGVDGCLVAVVAEWTAEAEHASTGGIVASATAPSIDAAWADLRATVGARVRCAG